MESDKLRFLQIFVCMICHTGNIDKKESDSETNEHKNKQTLRNEQTRVMKVSIISLRNNSHLYFLPTRLSYIYINVFSLLLIKTIIAHAHVCPSMSLKERFSFVILLKQKTFSRSDQI